MLSDALRPWRADPAPQCEVSVSPAMTKGRRCSSRFPTRSGRRARRPDGVRVLGVSCEASLYREDRPGKNLRHVSPVGG
jgi:hypothetical protein